MCLPLFLTRQSEDFLQCVNEQAGSQITRNLPADSDLAPATNPLLEDKAKNSSVDTGIKEINYEKVNPRQPGIVSFSEGTPHSGVHDKMSYRVMTIILMRQNAFQPKQLMRQNT